MAHKPTAIETLDPGPVVWGGVEFVHVRHEATGGEADVPAHLVAHHRSRGWEIYDPATPTEAAEIAEEASLSMKRSDLDDLAALAGVFEPELLPSKQAVLDALYTATDPSSTDDTTS